MWPWCGHGAPASASRSPVTATRSWAGAAERKKISTRSCKHTQCLSMSPKARWRKRNIWLKHLGGMTRQKSVR
ncbi:ribosome maturation protein SBDS [Taeniopygia guttata]|uniref:Putative Shwachman-Bodian-Diamond syndrome variant 2 n=1 Tax=Taeniopygia guttata TaxID=59729 RepID=B5G478_TAEGU|nr:ribosome maturation protein SBDS [Taeniopygia guttata]ACH46089.1 putative Shwachman-Bodian-Diamond syndrome variant 2 [Taeniopygia guttata]